MKILRYEKHSTDELIGKLRKVTLLHSTNTTSPICVYKDADIKIGEISVESIVPSQFYYLKDSLSKVEEIEKALMERQIDLFNLDGFINYHTNESDIEYNLLPVIIEYQKEIDGSINPIILDGIHRVILARKENLKTIQVVKIAGVNKNYPIYGFANPKVWQDVKAMKTAPSKKDKRRWRFPLDKVYKYYRDFNSVFENVGKPRK